MSLTCRLIQLGQQQEPQHDLLWLMGASCGNNAILDWFGREDIVVREADSLGKDHQMLHGFRMKAKSRTLRCTKCLDPGILSAGDLVFAYTHESRSNGGQKVLEVQGREREHFTRETRLYTNGWRNTTQESTLQWDTKNRAGAQQAMLLRPEHAATVPISRVSVQPSQYTI